MSSLVLRPYQQQAIDNTREFLIKRRMGTGIIHLFTGGGKSVIAVELVRQVFPLNKNRVIFTAPTIDLVFQMHANFKQDWPECQLPIQANNTLYPGLGIVMDKLDDNKARLIVASVPTLAKDVLNQSGWNLLSEGEQERIAALEPEEQQIALAKMVSEQWKYDVAPITKDDLVVDSAGNIRLSPTSKRSVLVSERFDRILANGGLPSVLIHDECFAAGTLVDGRPIESLQVGGSVLAFDETTQTFRNKKITHIFKRKPTSKIVVVSVNGQPIICTENHPFYTKRGWVAAGELNEQDEVLRSSVSGVSEDIPDQYSGREENRVFVWTRVDSVTVHEPGSDGRYGGLLPDGLVYNLEVEDFHTYTANGVVVHNCHHSIADGTLLLMQRLQQIAKVLGKPEIFLVGLTATPVRADQRGMGNLYKCMIISRDFRWAQRNGFLAPFAQPIRAFAKTDVETHSAAKHVQNWAEFVVQTWKEKASDRPTVFYAGKIDAAELTAVEASKALAKAFNEAGVPAVHFDGGCTIGPSGEVESKKERRKYLKLVMEGKIKVICNVATMIEGVDCPPISCIGLLRKMNEVQLTQAIGRAVRLFKGNEYLPPKEDMLLIDYTGEDLNVVPVGTLMGFKVDPTTREFVDVEDEEEDLLEEDDGKATADVMGMEGFVQGKEATYSIAKILSKSPGDWFVEDMTGTMSMAVGPKDTLVITMPQFTMAQNIDYLLHEGQNAMAGEPTDVPEFGQLTMDKLRQYIELLTRLRPLYENFALWHVAEQGGQHIVPRKWYLTSNPALDVLEAEAVQYAYHSIEGQVDILMSKNKRWKTRDTATQAQRSLLADLMGTTIDSLDKNMTKGDAAKLISHLKAYRAVAPFFTAIDKVMQPFAKYML